MVTYDPLQDAAHSDTEFSHAPSNIWVIRKQLRQKRPGKEDDVVVLSTYYVVGDAVYMAPAVSSVVGNRIVSPFFLPPFLRISAIFGADEN